MSRNIIVIVDSIDVNDSSGSKANVALIKNLLAIHYHVTVYHYTRKVINIEGASCISIKEQKNNVCYVLSRTQRVIQRYFKINLAQYLEKVFGFSFTFFNDVNSITSELKKIDISKVDFVLTLSKAASFRPHYAVSKLPKLYDKWMAYIHDPYPFSCYPIPYDWKESGYKIKEKFFKKVSEKARYSVFPSLLLQEWLGSFFPNFLKTGIIIPHQIFELNTKKTELPSFFEFNKFTLLHAGSLMKPRNPEGLILGFVEFLNRNPNAKNNSCLLFIGDASYHKKTLRQYKTDIQELSLQINKIDFDVAYKLQKQVAVNVILEAKSEISPFLPGKFPHCVSAKKPILILGPKNSEVKRLLGDDYEYWSEIDDYKNIAKKIEQLYANWIENKGAIDYSNLTKYMSEDYLKKIFSKL